MAPSLTEESLSRFYILKQLIAGFRPMRVSRGVDAERWRELSNPTRLAPAWIPLEVQFLTDDGMDYDASADGYEARNSDCPWVEGCLFVLLSERASEALASLLEPYGEFLPAPCPEVGKTYSIYHCLNHRLDRLDLMHSDGQRHKRGPNAGALSTVRTPILLPSRDEDAAFVLPFTGQQSAVIVSEKVKACAEAADLRGFRFDPVRVCAQCKR